MSYEEIYFNCGSVVNCINKKPFEFDSKSPNAIIKKIHLPFFKAETTPLSLHKFINVEQHKKNVQSHYKSSQSKVFNLKTQKIALHNGMGLKFGNHFNFQELRNNSQIMN